jgi:hypothetical protein
VYFVSVSFTRIIQHTVTYIAYSFLRKTERGQLEDLSVDGRIILTYKNVKVWGWIRKGARGGPTFFSEK